MPLALFFRAECVKWRKSWVLLTVLLAPICQVGFLTIILWFSNDLVRRFKPGFQFWFEINYLAWNLVFMPIVVALVSELSWDLELEAKAWSHLLVQPAPHRTHYLAKLLSHLALLLLSQILFAALLIPTGKLLESHLGYIMGPLNRLDFFSGTVPLRLWWTWACFSILASVPLVAFHTWLSTRFSGLVTGLAITAAGTWLGVRLAGTTAWVQGLPWGMSSQFAVFFDRWKRHLPWEYFYGSLAAAILLMVLGTLDFSRQKDPRL